MYSPYRIRLAILTSLGLVPLGCLPDRDTTTIEPSATDGSVDAGTLSTANSHCGTASCQTEDNSQKEQSQAMLSCGEGRELTGVLSSVEICGNRDGSREPLEACANDIVRGPLLKDPFRQTTASDAGAPVSTVANVPGADAGRTASGSITWTDAGTGGAGAPTEVLEIEPRCQTDADCGTGSVCNCGISNICLPAECQTDGDCDGDLKCVLTARAPQCYFSVEYFYACQAPKDECLTSCDTGSCLLRDGYRQCAEISWGGACGRPFLVEGQARMAQLECNSDWCKKTPQLNNDFLPFDAELSREEIGKHWAQIGLMEHASIAAFARFTLQLLHLGAPRDLVEKSQQATLDEARHTSACFEVAQRYLQSSVGPGPLPMDNALPTFSLSDVVRMVFREGCVGETTAALEANYAHAEASDSEVRRVLAMIGPDEQRHSELAWQFVAWALTEDPSCIRSVIGEEVELVRSELSQAMSCSDNRGAPAHGVLSPHATAAVRSSALRDVVLPCATALLENHSASQQLVTASSSTVASIRSSTTPNV